MTVTLVGTPDPEPPCVHYWHAVDRDEVILVCSYCRQTWSLDDPPDDDNGDAA